MQLHEAHQHRQLNGQESQGAADKALALYLPDKGPRSMEISIVCNCQDIGFECEPEKEQSGATQWIHAETLGVRLDSSCEDDTEGC